MTCNVPLRLLADLRQLEREHRGIQSIRHHHGLHPDQPLSRGAVVVAELHPGWRTFDERRGVWS